MARPEYTRPQAVVLACWLVWAMVLGGLLVCVMVVVKRDDLGAVWSPVQVGDSTVQPVEFVPVILVLYGVTAVLAATLIALFRDGHTWARYSLSVIVFGIFLVTVATVRTDPPTLVNAAAVAAAVLSAVTLVFLLHPQSRDFMRAAEKPEPTARQQRAAAAAAVSDRAELEDS